MDGAYKSCSQAYCNIIGTRTSNFSISAIKTRFSAQDNMSHTDVSLMFVKYCTED
jgi:hypothetical protein